MSERQYEHLGHTELASMCHHRDAKIAALTAENATLRAQVERAEALADALEQKVFAKNLTYTADGEVAGKWLDRPEYFELFRLAYGYRAANDQ